MKPTNKELAESRDTRERYKDYLVEEVGRLLGKEKSELSACFPKPPLDELAFWVARTRLQQVHYSTILEILAEYETDPQLEDILAVEEAEFNKLDTASKTEDFKLGFKSGYGTSHAYYKIFLDNVLFNIPGTMDGIKERRRERKEK